MITKAENAVAAGRHVKPGFRRNMKSKVLSFLVWACAALTIGILIYIILFILVRGVPHINLEFLFGSYDSENFSAFSSIVTTFEMIVLTLVFAVPIGVSCAIYLAEYAKKGNRVSKLVRLAVETLAGIPSIIYGLFGMMFFVRMLGFKTSVLSGVCTLSIMVLPVIISAAEEALRSVPDVYREGSYGLGATKLRTVVKVVLPTAIPGILSGIILSIGRIIGESAALIFTSGTNVLSNPTLNLMASQRTLAIHMYMLAVEGLPQQRNMAFATGSVLIVMVLLVNFMASALSNKMKGKELESGS